MKRQHIIALALLLLVVVFWFYRSGGGPGEAAIDLVEMFGQLPEDRRRATLPQDQAFQVQTVEIGGEQKKSLYAHPTTRVTYTVTIPNDAWFRAWLGIKPEAWTQPSDGVLFRVGVSDGRTYEELVNQHVDPANNASDRRWVPVTADLSAYAGQTVDIILNTNSSLPGRGDDPGNDWALWGSPEVIVQR